MVVLYEKTATTFTDNGLCVLSPSSCIVHEIAGGQYELELEHPMDDGRFELLVEERLIKAPVPETHIPQTTLPELIEWKVTAATASLYSKVPSTTYKNKNWKIIKAAKDNAAAYAFRGYHTYNIGAVAIDGGYVCRAKETVLGIAPSSAIGGGYWEILGTLDDAEPSHNAGTVIETLSQNDIIYKIADVGEHIKARVRASGKVGFIEKDACAATLNRESQILPAQTITEQVFRIYEVSCDEETNLYTVKAKHISYDFASNCLYDCKVTNVEPTEAIAAIQGALVEDDARTIATNIEGKKISEDWSFKNPINALLDPDSGIVGKTNAKLIRNNNEIYLLDSSNPRQGITIAYGVNMLGVNWRRSLENAVTRIIPRSGSADKGFTYISNGGRIYWDSSANPPQWKVQNQGKDYVESSVADQFAVKRIVSLTCSYQVGQKYKQADGEDATYDEQTVLSKMLTDAMEQFTVNGADGADIELDVEFLLLGDTEEYKQYKGLQNVNLYDIIPIRTGKIRINSTAQVTEYEYDCLRNRYNSIKLGKINSFNKRVAGYRVVNGSISYDKLAPELIDRIVSQNASGSEDSNPSWETSTGGSYPTMAPNTRDTDGIVTKGYGNAGKVWKTDADGNPAWRDEQAVSGFIPESEKGAANGVATLDNGGKVPATQLPSYVDDVLEYANKASFPATGEAGKIYVAKDTGKTYRWSGSAYVELSSYDEATQSASGLMSASDKAKLDGIEAQANKYVLPQATSGALGGIKIGWTGTGKDYPVELDSNGKAHVAVPWTDTTYTLPLAASGTRGGIQIGYSESGKKYAVKLDSEKAYVEVPWTADGGNAATVNGKTVAANVPADAKFTDHEYTAGTGLSLSNGQFAVRLAYSTSGKNYKVQADNSGNLYVNVPWENTVYSLPLAANGTRGGVQIGFTTDVTNRNYAVQLSSEKMYVNVPWQNTWRPVQDNLTSTSTTDCLSANQGKVLNDNKLDKITNGGIGGISGNGENWYFTLATLVVAYSWINNPIVFEVSRRGNTYGFQKLQVIFQSTASTDPDIASFVTDGYRREFYIKKTATSTWVIYGKYSELHGNCQLHRIVGGGVNNGVTVTPNLANAGTTAPTGVTEVESGWKTGYAVDSDTVDGKHASDFVLKAGDTMTGNLVVQKSAEVYVKSENTVSGVAAYLIAEPDGAHGLYSNGYWNGSAYVSNGKWIVKRDTAGNVSLNGDAATVSGGYTVKTNVPVGAVFTDTKNTTRTSQYDSDDSLHYIVTAMTQGSAELTNTHSSAYTDKNGYVYSGGQKVVTVAGGTLTGTLTVSNSNASLQAYNSQIGTSIMLGANPNGNHGLYSNGYWNGTNFVSDAKWIIYRNPNGNVLLAGDAATVSGGYTVKTNVPAGAVFTDTTYSAGTGLDLTNGAFSISIPRVSYDANEVPPKTTVRFREFQSSCANLPTAHYYHIYTGASYDTDYATQLALGMTADAVYYRRKQQTFGSWKRLAFDADKVSKAGDTMTGSLTIQRAGDAYVCVNNTSTGVRMFFGTGSGTVHGIYSDGYYNGSSFVSNGMYMLTRNGSGIVTVYGNCTGSAENATNDSSGRNIVSTYLEKTANGGLGSCAGNGTYPYFKLATLTIPNAYIDRPMVIELSRRGYGFQRLFIQFSSNSTSDPPLQYFGTDGENSKYWIRKSTTSTWEIYGQFDGVWGNCVVHRITGSVTNNGVNITLNFECLASIPSGMTEARAYGSAAKVPWTGIVSKPIDYFSGHSNGSSTNNYVKVTFPSAGHAIVAIEQYVGCIFLTGDGGCYFNLPSGYSASRVSGTNEVNIVRTTSTVFYIHGIFLHGTTELPVSNGT